MQGTFGEWLRQARRALQLSQEQLEVECGVPQATISQLELGQRSPKTKLVVALQKMTQTLNVSLIEAYLYAGLLDTEDERDQDAITVALLVRELSPQRRAELIDELRQEKG